MRLDSSVTEAEVREWLFESSNRAYGEERTEEMRAAIEKAARNIANVLQEPLPPMAEEPEYPQRWVQPGVRG
jgi:hypothetical protein